MAEQDGIGSVVTESLCWMCRYFWGRIEATGKFACRAFDEIPEQFISGEAEHRTVLPEQGPTDYEKVVFTPAVPVKEE